MTAVTRAREHAVRWVALLGGTFDPPHNGHLRAAQAGLRHPRVDEVRLVPSPSPPHKPLGARASFADRVEMCRLACAEMPGVSVWEIEGQGEASPHYTLETMDLAVRLLAPRVPAFLLGVDGLIDLPSWYSPRELLERHILLAVPRPGFDFGRVQPWVLQRVEVLEMEETDASSTAIRRDLPGSGNVPLLASVEHYIRRRRLYGADV
jgi:nicotinate-nucleotide adenylyltransferase